MSTPTVARPASLAEVVEAVRQSAGTLDVRGAGSKPWGNPVAPADVIIDTTALDAVIDHRADDATLAVQPGVRLEALQERLRAASQWLAVDPPLYDGATVGGVFAADDHGPARLRYGTLRDLVIGATVVLADGTVARTGGHVIKNVAGYDLARLLAGSLGTLGIVVELVLRLHPLPAASATVAVDGDAEAAAVLHKALLATALEPSALDFTGRDVLVRFEGDAEAVLAQASLCAEVAGGSARIVRGEDEAARWQAARDNLAGAEGETVVRGATLPDGLVAAAAAAARIGAPITSHVALGLHTLRLAAGDAVGHDAAVTAWREALVGVGGHAVVRRRAQGVTIDAWGVTPSAIGLMRRVKQALDPDGRLAPGRHAGSV